MTPQDITSATQILEIVAQYKTTEPVFRSYDRQAGECVLCNALFETIQGMADKYGLDPDTILERVRDAASQPAQPEQQA